MAQRGTGTFTVKHVDGVGRWRLVSAASVSLDEQGQTLILHHLPKACTRCGFESTEEKITSGHAYVMNDSGKTVAVYNLEKRHEGAEYGTGSAAAQGSAAQGNGR